MRLAMVFKGAWAVIVGLCFVWRRTESFSVLQGAHRISFQDTRAHGKKRTAVCQPLMRLSENDVNETPTPSLGSSRDDPRRLQETPTTGQMTSTRGTDTDIDVTGSPRATLSSGAHADGTREVVESSKELPWASVIDEMIESPQIELLGSLVVLLSSFCVAVSTVDNLDYSLLDVLNSVENGISILFLGEFILRWYANFFVKGFLTQPLILIDFVVVVLPFFLPMIASNMPVLGATLPPWLAGKSGLINLRLLRILRLQRVLLNMENFSKFQQALGVNTDEGSVKEYQLRLARVVLSVFTLVSISTGLILTTERGVNPNISTYFDGLYFGLTSLTTVGFGDITPVTAEGRLVVCCSILAGVAIIPAQAGALVEALLQRDQEKQKQQELKARSENGNVNQINSSGSPPIQPRDGMLDTRTPCPTCGATFHWSDAEFCWSCGNHL